jgi:parvulin-like peptidyl-prolyl isomerase
MDRKTQALMARGVTYLVILLYLLGDLWWFDGPLKRRLDALQAAPAASGPAGAGTRVARIFGDWITLGEIDQRVATDLARQGGPPPAGEHPALLRTRRTIALDQLMAERAIDAKLVARPELRPGPDEIAAAVAAEEARHGGPAALDAELAAAGLNRSTFGNRLAAEIARRQYLGHWLAAHPSSVLDEAEIAAWFEEQGAALAWPDRLRLRHIFKTTLNRDPEAVRSGLAAIRAALAADPAGFAAAAAAHSDDPASKDRGGDLGWIEDNPARLPGLDLAALRDAPAGVVTGPHRSRIGWHLIVVDERQAARPATLDELRPQIAALLQDERRAAVLRGLVDALHREGDALLLRGNPRADPPPTHPLDLPFTLPAP